MMTEGRWTIQVVCYYLCSAPRSSYQETHAEKGRPAFGSDPKRRT
jgi:hypothetical protein